jgi:hypothetical protein
MKIFKKISQPARQYISALSLVIFGFMLNYVPEWLSKLPGLSGKIFTEFNQFVKIKISMEIPAIVLFTIAAILIHYLAIIILRIIRHFKKPSYLKFTGMDYKDWKIAWEYEYLQKYKRYNIKNIHPVCKKCGCDLIEHHTTIGTDGIVCPICEKLYPSFMESAAIEKIIEHEITTSRPPKARPEEPGKVPKKNKK